jgi:tRNA (cmo5U34)-methyltransferase
MQNNSTAGIFGRPFSEKSTTDEIRARFDHDVERFSKLETGQQALADAPLVLELLAQSAAKRLQLGSALLDLGCGAGNFTLRILQEVSPLRCHLVDLSRPMLDRASTRIQATGITSVNCYQTDMRQLDFSPNSFDCIVAGAVLHHLRDEADWMTVFTHLRDWLKPGGRFYVADFVIFDAADVQELMWNRYGQHLEALGGPAHRQKVFDYVQKEDSPRSLPFQFELLRRTGFKEYDVLHRNGLNVCYFGTK